MKTLTRRAFIQRSLLASGTLVLSSCSTSRFNPFSSALPSDADSPINRYVPGIAERSYFGPNPERPHKIFWSGTPQPEPTSWIKHSGPVIIGGGMSGLSAAYLLRDKNPLVLEATSHFGGNSQGQVWGSIPYSIGAAYIVNFEEGDQVHGFLTELDLVSKLTRSESEDQYYLGGKIHQGLWHGGKAVYGSKAAQVERLLKHMTAMLNDEEGTPYPDIPTDDSELRSYINKLDRISFKSYLEKFFKGAVPEPLGTALEQYCWSSLGGSASELSAASSLNFYTSELDAICVFDAGNSRITQTLYESLIQRCGRSALKSDTIISKVEATENGVRITAHDADGEIYGIEAPLAIVACPKFVAKKIIKDLPVDQFGAFNRVRYRSYLVANALLKGPQATNFYDLYLLQQQNGKPFAANTPIEGLGATDVIVANWNSHQNGDIVLNLYRALPYDGARAEVYLPNSYDRARVVFEKQITSELLPLFGIPTSNIVDLRLTRWGHALPLAETNLIADGLPELLTRPVKDKIFFCNQDNWALPAFETAVAEAYTTVGKVRPLL